MKALLLSLTILFSAALYSHEGQELLKILPNYLKVQEALAADNFKVASDEASKVTHDSFKTLKTMKDIKTFREEFKKVSGHFAMWAKKENYPDVEVKFCSMANARWVQKKGSVANPYYGKEMLTCGEPAN